VTSVKRSSWGCDILPSVRARRTGGPDDTIVAPRLPV
jgi:hypothetical protein